MSLVNQLEELRQQGVALYMAGRAEEALPYFDQALACDPDEEARDLILINKASAQLSLKLVTDEVQELPQILLRRPKLRGLAAYSLAARFENEQDYKRARFYLTLALNTAEEQGDERLRIVSLVDLGNVCVYDSKLDDAIAYYREALELTEQKSEYQFWRAFARGNMGYCLLMKDQPREGAELIQEAIELFRQNGGEAYTAEGLIDLCLAYLDLNDLEKARTFGEEGLAKATESRQVRNAHYLLGEVAYKSGDIALAQEHFGHLAKFYPDFPQLTNVLFVLDLRKMVNFRL